MRRVMKVQTLDGALHDSERDAKRHAEAKYADKLCSLAHKLVAITKYSDMLDFIDANLGVFEELQRLKADTILETNEGEDE